MKPLREIFAENLKRAMRDKPELDSWPSLAKKSYWPADNINGGSALSPGSIGNALKPKKGSPSPALDLVDAVSTALGVRPWELLVTEEEREILDRIFPRKTAQEPKTQRGKGRGSDHQRPDAD